MLGDDLLGKGDDRQQNNRIFPEATFGPSTNIVGITQHLRERGHNPVFIADRSFTDQFKRWFSERMVNIWELMNETAARGPEPWCVIHDPGCIVPGIVCAEHCPRAVSHGPRDALGET